MIHPIRTMFGRSPVREWAVVLVVCGAVSGAASVFVFGGEWEARTAEATGGEWQIETVDAEDWSRPKVALDGSDVPTVAYYRTYHSVYHKSKIQVTVRGADGWSSERAVSEEDYTYSSIALAVGSEGRPSLTFLWDHADPPGPYSGVRPGRYDLLSFAWRDGGGWSHGALQRDDDLQLHRPNVAVDADGTAHVGWALFSGRGKRLVHFWRPRSGDGETESCERPTPREPGVVMLDDDGLPHAFTAVPEPNVRHTWMTAEGDCESRRVFDEPRRVELWPEGAATDREGRMRLVFREKLDDNDSAYRLGVREDGDWSFSSVDAIDVSDARLGPVELAAGRTGHLIYAVFTPYAPGADRWELRYATHPPGSRNWMSEVVATIHGKYSADLAVGSDDAPHVVFTSSRPSGDDSEVVRYARPK